MTLPRRRFLKLAGLGTLAFGLPPPFLVRAAAKTTSVRGKTLVVIFLRGGIDGLNVLIPFKERTYYSFRPSIAIPEPASGENRSLDLDGFYSLHPSLAPIYPLYEKGQLALIQGAGSPDNTRSHFDAQDYMENGTPGQKSTQDGWLNRYLQEEKRNSNSFRAVALSTNLARILGGSAPALTLSSIEEFRLHDESLSSAISTLYRNSENSLLRQGSENLFQSMAALRKIRATIPSASGNYPRGRFGRSLAEIAPLIKANMGLEIAFTESNGWDTHANQGGTNGAMARRLEKLAQGVLAFYRDLGDRMEDVLLLTLSEFGRTVRENGNGGTDHGHANMMFLLGGKIQGGKIYGRWPGLAPELLFEGRDLDLTTDFRNICVDALSQHLGVKIFGHIFPGFRPSPSPLRWRA